MADWREKIAPRAVLWITLSVLVTLLVWTAFREPALESSVWAASEWLPPSDREAVDISGPLYTVDGHVYRLSEVQDQVLFLNFWATWCGPCRMEMPSMAGLHEQLSAQGLTIAAITSEDFDTVRTYLEQNPHPFLILIDPDSRFHERFGVSALPSSLILDRAARVTYGRQGAVDWNTPEVTDKFRRLLAE